jgi:predicted MPP superfamily phosphohydrolase
MKRLLQPFIVTVTAILALGYVYLAVRLSSNVWQRVGLALPFILVWLVPVVYWGGNRDRERALDHVLHQASYLCMAWLSFLLVLTLGRDVALLLTMWSPSLAPVHDLFEQAGVLMVFAGSLAAMVIGALAALRGPRLKQVDVTIDGLHRDLDGFRIAQISDLHVGPTIRTRYVERVVQMTCALEPDVIALTGDIVDGPVERLGGYVAPLQRFAAAKDTYFVLGNHDCYAGAAAWTAHFKAMGMNVLLNTHATVIRGAARIHIGGVLDPAVRLTHPGLEPRADLAAHGAQTASFRLLLAHNPKIAPLAQRAGFDLQLSGHTHAGQFFPWTLAVRLVHAPHVAGLSREGPMWVYVSAGTGTWGPPVRFGTEPELTLIRLVRG